MKRWTLAALACASGVPLLVSACAGSGEGVKPDTSKIYFPVGLAILGEGDVRHLAVLNSDFDLQYNRGTIQSFDLERLRSVARVPCSSDEQCAEGQHCDVEVSEENDGLPSYFCVADTGDHANLPCGAFPENTASARAFSPGRCGAIDITAPQDDPEGKLAPLLHDTVLISAFATDLLRVTSPDGKIERLFLPVRGDASVQWLDVEAGKFRCGQSDGSQECDTSYRVATGTDVLVDNPLIADSEGYTTTVKDEAVLPPEGFGIAASADGQRILVTHQNATTGKNISGQVSAILNRWDSEPELVSIQAGLALNPMGVGAIPIARVDQNTDYEQGFLVTFRSEARLQLMRFYDDGALGAGGAASVEAATPFVRVIGSVPITTNASGVDTRAVLVDDTARKAAESDCGDDPDCLTVAGETPLDVYLLNRSPASLIFGKTKDVVNNQKSTDYPTFYDNLTLTEGPSRLFAGNIVDSDGKPQRRLFAICFDSSSIFVIDPVLRRIESQIFTGRGPHSIVFDPERPIAYVAHFTDSYLGIVSLDQRVPQNYGAMLAMVGTPTRPRASK